MNAKIDNPGHEQKDADVIFLFMTSIFLLVSTVVVFLIVSGMMRYLEFHEASKIAGQATIPVATTERFPEPRLEVKVAGDLTALRTAEEVDLNSYDWIDRNTGTVRVPIECAMQLLVQRGLPDVGAGQTPLSLMQARPSETAAPPRLIPKR